MSEEQQSSGEYERERVPDHALLGAGKFWGMYAGEHAAGTEFMIGPLFLAAGASLQDLILGLLLGNVLGRADVAISGHADRDGQTDDALLPTRADCRRIAGQALQRRQWIAVLLSCRCDGDGFGIVPWVFRLASRLTCREQMFGLSNAVVHDVGGDRRHRHRGGGGGGLRNGRSGRQHRGAMDDRGLCGVRNRFARTDGRDQHAALFGRKVLDRCDRLRAREERTADVWLLADRRVRVALQRCDALRHGGPFDLSIRQEQGVRLGTGDRNVSR